MKANDDRAWWRTAAPGPREIGTATADLRCRRQDNLVGLWLAVERAYQKQAIEQNVDALRAERRRWDSYLRNANAVS